MTDGPAGGATAQAPSVAAAPETTTIELQRMECSLETLRISLPLIGALSSGHRRLTQTFCGIADFAARNHAFPLARKQARTATGLADGDAD
jgi:hypothetical protein